MLRQARVHLALIAIITASLLPFYINHTYAETTAINVQVGFPKLDPYGSFFVSPSVVDINGDGKLDVLTADSTGCVWGYDRSGALLPTFPWKTGGVCDNAPRINSPLAIADLDRDGKLEVVAGTRGSGPNSGQRGKVFVWRNNGTLVSGWPKEMAWAYITNGNEPEVYSVTVANIVGDANLEVIGVTSNEAGSNTNYAPNVYAWTVGGSLLSGFPLSSHKGSGIFGQVGAADINGDGYAEILIGRDEIYYYAYNGQGQQRSGWPLHTYVDDYKRTWGQDDYLEFTRSAPAVADLDGDGTKEIIIAGKIRSAAYTQISSGVLVVQPDGKRRAGWSKAKMVGPPMQTSFTPNNQVALGDLDNDGKLEIVVTFDDGTIRAFRENGTQMWSYNYTGGKKLFASEVAIGDVTGDGKLDIVFGTYSFDSTANTSVRMHAITATGQWQGPFPLTPSLEGTGSAAKGFMGGPTLADLDGDGSTEIIAHSRGGVLYAWDTGVTYRADRMPWPTARQNNARTGEGKRPAAPPSTPTPTPPPTGSLAVSKLTLINADTDQPISGFTVLNSGNVLNLGTLPTRNLNILATTSPELVGSVRFTLDGAVVATESGWPYAMAGNNGTDYLPWTPTAGSHTLTAVAYSGANATGSASAPLTINFTVESGASGSGPAVTKASLINADNDRPVSGFTVLNSGNVLNLGTLPTRNLNILAATSPAKVGSVRFVLDGAVFSTENVPPYAMAGDNGGSNYYAWTPKVGSHTLKITAYSGANATGSAGPTLTINFTVQ
ncbi:MAG TPA: VCBS repeat-containing protein [Herpetosiphonaceae bacterium]|nr:VCBS repeat-containing protein [Herpetosiphonaceae bacterium]